jgi:hypothetical protein
MLHPFDVRLRLTSHLQVVSTVLLSLRAVLAAVVRCDLRAAASIIARG